MRSGRHYHFFNKTTDARNYYRNRTHTLAARNDHSIHDGRPDSYFARHRHRGIDYSRHPGSKSALSEPGNMEALHSNMILKTPILSSESQSGLIALGLLIMLGYLLSIG